MGKIFQELQAEADERATRSAFEAWMRRRGTPLHLEQTQAYEAFKAGMTHQACMDAVLKFQAESRKTPNAEVTGLGRNRSNDDQ